MKIKFPSLSADDIFISYSRKDANTYAVGLADQLTKRGFSCFFDRLGTDADRNLPPSLIRKIKGCTMLVLVGTDAAGASKFVTQEIDEFAEANGTSRAVPIDFGGTLATAVWYPKIVGIAPESEDAVALLSGNPSATVVNRIEKSFNYVRSKDRLRRYTIGTGVVLMLLVLASVAAAFVAKSQVTQAQLAKVEADKANVEATNSKKVATEQERLAVAATENARLAVLKADEETRRAQQAEDDAREAKDQALAAKTEANKQRTLADLASKRAEGERIKAERETLNAKASGLVSIARGMTETDPLTASLLLLEAKSPVEPSGGVAAARDLISHYVAKTVLRGHVKSSNDVVGIYSVAYSPDGKHVVTAGADDTARVWATETNGNSVVLRGHQGKVLRAEFSPDSTRVLTASEDGSSRLWNADGTGAPVVFHGSESQSSSTVARLSPDGKRVLTVEADNAARIWNADGSGTPIVLPHPDYIAAAAFSPDGKLVATGSGDNLARVWNADGSGQPILLSGNDGAVTAVDFSFDSKFIVTGSLRGGARVYRVDGAGEPVVLGHPNAQVQIVKFSPNGKRVAMAIFRDGPNKLEIQAADGTGEPVLFSSVEPNSGPPTTIAFSKDGKRILVSWLGGNAEVWNADGTGEPLVLHGETSLSGAAFSPDEREIATASYDGTARVWTRSLADEPVVLAGDPGFKAHFSSDGQRIVAAVRNGSPTDENTALLWNADGTGAPVMLRGHEDSIYTAGFSPDGSKVVTGSFDGTARIWSSDGGTPVKLDCGGAVFIADFSPNSSQVLTVTNGEKHGDAVTQDGVLRVWPADGRGAPLVLKGHSGRINSAYFSPDGKHIVTAGSDGTIRLWQTEVAAAPVLLAGHKFGALDARFDRSGRRIVSVAEDKTAMIRNVDGSGTPVVWNADHELKSAEFSPDGERVVILAKSSSVAYLWNADSGQPPSILSGHTGTINNVQFSNDGKYILTGSDDGSARVWLADGTGEALVLEAEPNESSTRVSWAEFSSDGNRVLTVSYPMVVSKVTARVWTVSWAELTRQLRHRTGECLSADQRIKYLGEAEDQAKLQASDCERRFGRSPARE